VRSGVALNLWHYQHNRSGFTYGQGGYYSPQAYVSAQLPLEVAHRDGPWTHGMRGYLTYTWAKESAAPYFPLDTAFQTAAGDPVRAASINHGLGVALRANSEYRISPKWSVGALAEWERSRDYNPYRVGLYLRHYFNGAEGPAPSPPRPVVPYVRY
jgi:cellulose synthase operon protein C